MMLLPRDERTKKKTRLARLFNVFSGSFEFFCSTVAKWWQMPFLVADLHPKIIDFPYKSGLPSPRGKFVERRLSRHLPELKIVELSTFFNVQSVLCGTVQLSAGGKMVAMPPSTRYKKPWASPIAPKPMALASITYQISLTLIYYIN